MKYVLTLEQEKEIIKLKKNKNYIIIEKYNISESRIYGILKRNGRKRVI